MARHATWHAGVSPSGCSQVQDGAGVKGSFPPSPLRREAAPSGGWRHASDRVARDSPRTCGVGEGTRGASRAERGACGRGAPGSAALPACQCVAWLRCVDAATTRTAAHRKLINAILLKRHKSQCIYPYPDISRLIFLLYQLVESIYSAVKPCSVTHFILYCIFEQIPLLFWNLRTPHEFYDVKGWIRQRQYQRLNAMAHLAIAHLARPTKNHTKWSALLQRHSDHAKWIDTKKAGNSMHQVKQ
jgi:hypothetical protein